MAPDEIDIWGRWAAPGERPGEEERPFTVTDYSNSPRDSTRVPLAHRIQLKFDRFSGFIGEYVSNLSPGGIFIRTESPEDPGQLLEFEFRLGDGFELIRGRGEVVWARQVAEGADRPKGMGVRFLELSPGSKDLIYKIVDDFVAHGGKPFDLTPPDASQPDPSTDATMPLTLPAASRAAGPLKAAAATPPRPVQAAATPPRPIDPVVQALPRPMVPPLPPPRQSDPGLPPPRQALPVPPRQADNPALPWSLDLPAIRPVPGVPAITPRSPLELLGSSPADAPSPPESADGEMPPAGRPAVAGTSGMLPAAGAAGGAHPAGDGSRASGAGETAMDPLEQMLASLPPLDDLAAGLSPSPASPALPATPGAPAPRLPSPTSAPAPPALPFSAFDLRAPLRRSRLPLIAAVVVAALLGAGAYLLRDTILGWMGGGNGGASAAAPAVTPRRAAPRTLHASAGMAGTGAASSQAPGSPGPGSAVPGSLAPGSAVPGSPLPGSQASGPLPPGSPAPGATAAGQLPGARAFSPAAAVAAPPAGGAASSPRVQAQTAGAGSPAGAASSTGGPRAAPAPGRSAAAAQTAGPSATPGASDAAGSAGLQPPPLVSARPGGPPATGSGTAAGASSPAPSAGAAGASATAAAAPGGARLTALERITWEATRGGTDVVLWGNGDFTPQSFTRSRVGGVGGLPVREVVRLVGITRPFTQSKIAVATPEIAQIRIGSHPHDELHVVIDLTGRGVTVAGVELAPHQLRLHLGH
jgi:molecular chaperone DnaK